MGKFKAAPLAQFLTPSAPNVEAPKPAKAAEPQPAPTKAAEPKAPAAKRQPKAPKQNPRELELAQKSRAAKNAKYIKRGYDYRTPGDGENPRTRRVQLLMKPDIYNHAAALANLQGESLNHFIENLILERLAAADIVDTPPPPINKKGKATK